MFTYDGRWTGDCVFKDTPDSKTRGGFVTKPSGLAIDVRGPHLCVRLERSLCENFRRPRRLHEGDLQHSGQRGRASRHRYRFDRSLVFSPTQLTDAYKYFNPISDYGCARLVAKAKPTATYNCRAGLSIDRVNQVYCSDYGTSKVSVFTKTGALVRSFGSKGARTRIVQRSARSGRGQ